MSNQQTEAKNASNVFHKCERKFRRSNASGHTPSAHKEPSMNDNATRFAGRDSVILIGSDVRTIRLELFESRNP